MKDRVTLRRQICIALVVAAIVGAACCAIVLSGELDRNPQQEFYSTETGAIYWDAVAPLALLTFGFPAGLVLFIGLVIIKVWRDVSRFD